MESQSQSAIISDKPTYARRMLQLLAGHKGALAAFLGMSLLHSLCGVAAPLITQAILDRVLPTGNLGALAGYIAVLGVVTIFQLYLVMHRRFVLIRISSDIDRSLLSELLAHVLSLPTQYFKVRRVGDLVARFSDSAQLRHVLAGSMTRAAVDSAMVLLYFGIMLTYDTRLAWLVIGCLVLFAGYTFWMGPVVKRLHARVLATQSAHEAQLFESLTAIDLVKSMGLEATAHQKWTDAFQSYLTTDQRRQLLRQFLECTGAAIRFLCTMTLIGYGTYLVMEARLSVGQLVAFSLFAGEAIAPIIRLTALWQELQEAQAGLERVQEVLDEEPERQCSPEMRIYPERIEGRIRFENVHFDYGQKGEEPLLRGVDFEIRPGEHVGLVGRSGSGKTTIGRLLLGLYQPTAGRVLIDDWDLARIDHVTFRRRVGVVLQENLLLAGTIRENITLGDGNGDDMRLREAARLAGADEFIDSLPMGYDTVVGEMGLTLSGGQRQRINLARALYRDPCILLLDEATSNLDEATEREIQQRLKQILDTRAALIITHNPAMLECCDRMLFLESAGIRESSGNISRG